MKNKREKNSKGWVRLVEVFIAILLLTGVLLVVVSRSNSPDENKLHIEIAQKEIAILRDIELNNTLRTEILNVASLPVEWEDFNSQGLQEVKDRINYLMPSNFECEAKICEIYETCVIDEFSEENIYAESVLISANLNTYSPRQLKLFCVVGKD